MPGEPEKGFEQCQPLHQTATYSNANRILTTT